MLGVPYRGEYEVLGDQLNLRITGPGTLLAMSSVRCEVTTATAHAARAGANKAEPTASAALRYPMDFDEARPLNDGMYRVRWIAHPSAAGASLEQLRYDVFSMEAGRIVE